MIKLSISVMHCSWNADRVIMLNNLVNKLGDKKTLRKELLKFSISDDAHKQGIWFNCKQAWSQAHQEATHHLVLQDDMLPCDNFIEIVKHIISLKPEEPICIFNSNNATHIAAMQEKHWYLTHEGSWGGSVILPRKHFKWFEWVDEHIQNFSIHEDDTRMDYYVTCNDLKFWNVTPGLIEHVGYDKSLIGGLAEEFRRSKSFLGSFDSKQIDWNKGLDSPVIADLTWNNYWHKLYKNIKPQYLLQIDDQLKLKEKIKEQYPPYVNMELVTGIKF